MTLGFRLVAVFVAASLVLAGPWLPGTLAQQPPQSPPPAQAAPPAPSDQPAAPAPPPQPELYRETPQPAPPYQPGMMGPDRGRMPYEAYAAAAGVSTLFLVPGRTLTCALGTGLFLGTLALTFGSGYRFATSILEEGCGGKWIVRAEDFTPDRPETPSATPPPR